MAQNPLQQQLRQKRDQEIKESYPTLTLRSIAEKHNITVERVRQILRKEHQKVVREAIAN